jgi:nucleolar protein 6
VKSQANPPKFILPYSTNLSLNFLTFSYSSLVIPNPISRINTYTMAPKHSNDPVSRQDRKANKRKLEDAVPDLPSDNDDNEEVAPVKSEGEERKSKKARKEEKKKAKKTEGQSDGSEEGKTDGGGDAVKDEEPAKTNLLGEVEAPRKSKKERKAERKAKDAVAKASGPSLTSEEPQPTSTETNSEPQSAQERPPQSTSTKTNNIYRDKKRAEKSLKKASNPSYTDKFIIFVGNLPFTATTASIEKHFGTVKPKSIRHLTKKEDPTKSRGCAFVEFDDYTQMESALRLFHHSLFEGRKINVELT